ncbi:acetyl-CoA carboxylase biotin carboxyl carrier protein [Peribacillus frigoritolerans]|uniref:acetyl-CoA carboxylase biotin carboxyl carrier protein n=1 Tax=Peribacillus frigoritolerans TaxID=450367 RepID=UPI0021D23B34|nr:acetyl-CoA carboxylase biotin carboxyl carrier protein [Peribacillus frigoritolerans]MCU6598991.1 acetyl-CoA carboxylase biotin carboxyl carrier protein [Peribacillus frigoritolerans]
MFKIHEIREMIKLVDETSIEQLEIEEGDSKVLIQRNVGVVPVFTKTPAVVPITSINEISKGRVQVAAAKVTEEKVHKAPKIENDENYSKIVSPMVGTFYAAPSEDAAPFVKSGDKVEEATIVCILEAMKLFNEIEAEMDGEIVEVLVENGQLVEYGQPLFLVKQTS